MDCLNGRSKFGRLLEQDWNSRFHCIAYIEVHCKVGDKMLKTTVSTLSEEMKGDVYVDTI